MRIGNCDIEVVAFAPAGLRNSNPVPMDFIPDERAPIVLLHEGLGSTSAWGAFPSDLAAASGRTVLAYDRRGYGRSGDWQPPWGVDFLARETDEVLAPLLTELIGRPAVLVGHSDGATIALASPWWLQQRDKMECLPLGIVSIAAHVFVEEISIRAVEALVADPAPLVQRISRHHRNPVEVVSGWSGAWTSPLMANWHLHAELAAIRCPILAIQGTLDQFGTLEQVRRIVTHARGPVREELLADVDHWPHRERPAEVLRLVSEFADSVDP